jgi:serine/threonine protein phosphatase PrpC
VKAESKAEPDPVPAVGEGPGQVKAESKAEPDPVPAVGVGPGQVKAESKAEPDPVPAVGVGPGQVKAESKADPGPSLVEREGSGQIPAGTKADPGPVPAVGEGAGQITAGPKAGPGTIHPLGGVVVPPSPANLDFNNVVTNDADFSKSEPIIYINLESRMKGNWEEVENQIKNIMNIFKDISVGSVTTLVEEKYHFYENYIVTNVITNKYMKDIIGLNAEGKNNRLTITGIPNSGYDGTLKFKLSFDIISLDRIDRICEEKSVELYIPVNPKDLWKNLPVLDFEGYEYPNEKAESVAISSMGKILTVASCRGRSHAHAGKPRDDNYDFKCDLGSGWNVVAAADGAGSARFSRKGSDLACTTVVETLAKIFSDIDNLKIIESEIRQMHENLKMNHVSLEKDDNLKTPLNETIYTTVYAAYKSILDEYKQKKESHQSYDDITLSAYHTTLMFMFFKKFDFGYFFGSFWIGDGAIVLYNLNGTGEVKVLGKPDSGEFAGQTRFLTMKGEIDREKVKERTRLNFAESFEAIILATDGITDPYFPSDADTQSPEKWNNFWTKILKEGDKGSDKDNVGCPELFNADATLEEKAKALLKWLEFWSKGNHDDRTLLIVT